MRNGALLFLTFRSRSSLRCGSLASLTAMPSLTPRRRGAKLAAREGVDLYVELGAVVDLLNEAGIDYALCGGLAVDLEKLGFEPAGEGPGVA